jgi:hypothetical protein
MEIMTRLSNKASDVVADMATRPLSAKQIREQQERESPRGNRIVTPAGQIVEEGSGVVGTLPVQTDD